MAAIGYHFGSKEALLNAALVELNGKEFGDEVERALKAAPPDADPLERFAMTWDALGAAIGRHQRLLAAGIENLAQVERIPAMRDALAEGHQQARSALAEMVKSTALELGETAADEVAALYYTVMNGLMMYWLVDSENAPTGRELADAVRALAGAAKSAGAPEEGDPPHSA